MSKSLLTPEERRAANKLAVHKYRAANRERVAAMNHGYYAKDKAAWKLRSNTWKKNNPARNMFNTVKSRAKREGIPFNLTIDDIVIPEFCPVLGIKLESAIMKGLGPTLASPSLDKLVPSRGYVKGNIAIISNLANMIKSAGTPEQVQAVATWMKLNVPAE